ncbi:hypothetical protein AWQ21_04245 [Picosynechococcus sp. PCC 7003]|uniref:PP2C family protein-serine/threonine phosphatase n=1 Tax=Picosynechococcus sp. PCC 7003 TaxID=374981 RepID=UPI0008106874|nr:PP2C family serine/threonine-protein phosphatase [Picosynechococcus sp. PCC 7003]ANV83660.1 hypothetical protein AWQ21_04245 [Picosynechococcus sp. PCC 7003]
MSHALHSQVQDAISRWLSSGNKCGLTTVDRGHVVLGSVLGNRQENQDRTLFFQVRFEDNRKPPMFALVLCDGMGGMQEGGDCANLAISSFTATLIHSNEKSLSQKLSAAVDIANKTVYKHFQGKGGSTLSSIACQNHEWAIVNVGDSRIYAVYDEKPIEQLTTDDTLEEQLAELRLKAPPPEFRQLLQFVGMGDGIEPTTSIVRTENLKFILLTSDGAHSIPQKVFQEIIQNAKSITEIVDRLTRISVWLGGKDNATISAISINSLSNQLNSKKEDSRLEVWSLPGKTDFFTIKVSDSLPSHQNEVQSTDINKEKNTRKPNKQRKQKSSLENQKKQDKPQLKIEFTEEVAIND